MNVDINQARSWGMEDEATTLGPKKREAQSLEDPNYPLQKEMICVSLATDEYKQSKKTDPPLLVT